MATRIDAYVDTSALIAFADRSDSYHLLFRRLFSDPPAMVTTTLALAEGHGWFLRRYDRNRALQFMGMIEAMTPLGIAAVGAAEQRAATDVMRRFTDQDLTLTDAVGLVLMAAKGIGSCWSTEFHPGLTVVRMAPCTEDSRYRIDQSAVARSFLGFPCRRLTRPLAGNTQGYLAALEGVAPKSPLS